MTKNKYVITQEIKTTKTFTYTEGDVTLSFSLTIDDTTQIKKFKQLLEVAIKDVSEVIEWLEDKNE